MGIRKDIEIDGQMVAFKASAAIPRIYRLKFQRDIYKDLALLEKSIGDGKEESSNLDMFSLRCLRILLLLWQSMQTRPSRIHQRSGLIISIHFQFIVFCHSLSSFGG